MNGVGILFFLCVVLFPTTRAIHVEGFQFQCYGERTLCMFPNEYCSSDSRKCVECSREICSEVDNIPKACRQICVGGEEQHQTSWLKQFIAATVVASILSLLCLCKLVLYLIKRYKSQRENGQTDLCFISSVSIETGTSTRSSPELKRLVHPTSDVGEGDQEERYCERKLKNVNPSQNPHTEYKPTPSSKGLSPSQSFT